jgi:hypothetical protein
VLIRRTGLLSGAVFCVWTVLLATFKAAFSADGDALPVSGQPGLRRWGWLFGDGRPGFRQTRFLALWEKKSMEKKQ